MPSIPNRRTIGAALGTDRADGCGFWGRYGEWDHGIGAWNGQKKGTAARWTLACRDAHRQRMALDEATGELRRRHCQSNRSPPDRPDPPTAAAGPERSDGNVNHSSSFHRRLRAAGGAVLISIVAAIASGTGCREKPEAPAADVVATVGATRIRVADVEAEIRRQPAANTVDDEARRRQALDVLLDEASLYRQATEAGFDRTPDLQRRWQRLVAREWRERALTNGPSEAVSEAQVQDWYDTHRDRFRVPEKVRASLIALHVSSRAEPAKREAARRRLSEVRDAVLAAPQREDAFARQARDLSDDAATRLHDGAAGWIVLGRTPLRWPEEVGRALSAAAETGPLSPVLETPSGYYLVAVWERDPASYRPLAQVRDTVVNQLQQTRAEERERQVRAAARQAAGVQLHPEALARVRVPAAAPSSPAGTPPPPLPGSATLTALPDSPP